MIPNIKRPPALQAVSVHGRNPQNLIETTIKYRIWDSLYWKEHCFALDAATVIDRCVSDVRYVGGTYANQRPSEFLCLTLKLLQLQPQREIILEYLRAEEFKCTPFPSLSPFTLFSHRRKGA